MQTVLAPGELLRSIHLPAEALSARVAFRRLSLSNLGRSGVLLIGRLDPVFGLVITVTASTKRPVQLRFPADQVPDADAWPPSSSIPSRGRSTTMTSTDCRHGAAT
jgi:hypothetical protein